MRIRAETKNKKKKMTAATAATTTTTATVIAACCIVLLSTTTNAFRSGCYRFSGFSSSSRRSRLPLAFAPTTTASRTLSTTATETTSSRRRWRATTMTKKKTTTTTHLAATKWSPARWSPDRQGGEIDGGGGRWTGQNAYFAQQQQQQQQRQQTRQSSRGGRTQTRRLIQPHIKADDVAAEMLDSHRERSNAAAVAAAAEASASASASASAYNDYNFDEYDMDEEEMRFLNYLLELQRRMEEEEEEEEDEDEDWGREWEGACDERGDEASAREASTATTTAATPSSSSSAERAEEDLDALGDKFLKMLSNEVDYKDKLMGKKSPYSSSSSRGTAEEAEAEAAAPPPRAAESAAPSATTTTAAVASTAEEPSQEDRFLRMVSNEVSYKKFIGQSPYSVSDIEFRVLRQRFLDNLEDSTQKNNGKFKGESKLKGKKGPREERKTVVVLGTGWAAHAFVKLASTYDLRIVVVSPVNHFVFTPMLASAAVGTVEYRSMTEPIRVTNPYIDNFVEGRAIGVDVENKMVQVLLTSMGTATGAFRGVASAGPCRLEPEPVQTQIVFGEDGTVMRDKTQGAGGVIELSYDYLLCAVGTSSRSSIVKGAKEYCFNLKTSQDSKRLRTAIGEALELASRPTLQEFYYPDEQRQIEAREERQRQVRIAVVGGGPTGVELCGELCDFFAQVCRSPDGAYQRLREDIEVMLIHGGNELLPAMDKDLRQRALEALEDQGVKVYLNTRLNEVGLDFIKIGQKGSNVEETIPVGLTVWAAGNAPVPFVKELLSQLPASAAGSAGRINVDPWLRCPTKSPESFGSILVLGDVACFEAQNKYDVGPVPLPQTAQVAGQQGAFVARMLNRGYDLRSTTAPRLPDPSESDSESFSLMRAWLTSRGLEEAPGFDFLSLGLLAYVGREEALNQVMLGNVPLFNYSGRVAFALWRSVYLAKQASSRNQALIAFDWLRTEAFGRDITRL